MANETASTERPTEDQANAALRALLHPESAQAEPEPEPEPEPAAVATPEAPGGEEPAPEEPTAVETEQPAAVDDDVASLRARLAEHEARAKTVEESATKRVKAMQERFAANERILREKYLRKSNVVDRSLKVLKAARSTDGVPQAEADRVIAEIESTMNPASQSYAPPVPVAVEDQALVLNSFLNEQSMTVDEADEFGKWMRSDASTALTPYEQAVAERDLDGFLRLAFTRWREGAKVADTTKQRNDAIEAAKVVQRRQRETARAASATPTAPRKSSPAPKTAVDLKKLTNDDLSVLLRKAVDEAKNS